MQKQLLKASGQNPTCMRSNGFPDGSNLFLTGTILLANTDYTGLLDYALKALVGGAIWFTYKVSAEYLIRKKKKDE